MKSVFLTFVMFAITFALLKVGLVSFITGNTFRYISYGCFLLVLAAAIYYVGIPRPSTKNKDNQEKSSNTSHNKEADDEK